MLASTFIIIWSLAGVAVAIHIAGYYSVYEWHHATEKRGTIKNAALLFGIGPVVWIVLLLMWLSIPCTKNSDVKKTTK